MLGAVQALLQPFQSKTYDRLIITSHCVAPLLRFYPAYDVLFLRQQGLKYPKYHLTTPLRPESNIKLSYGASVAASELIGRQILDRVADSKGNPVTLYEPTLASYIINSERMATPVS